jgi:hypothetical protein
MKDAYGATLGASAFRVQGHVNDDNTAMVVDVYFDSAGSLVTVTEHKDRTINLILDGPSLYMKANLPFGSLRRTTRRLRHPVQNCARSSSRYVGTATVHGLKAVKIHPSSGKESDTYYIKSGPTPYILRVTGSSSQNQSGDISFNDYGIQPDTAAPLGAIPFSNSGSTGSTG